MPGCKGAKEKAQAQAETRELKAKLAELEKERSEGADQWDEALSAQLDKARQELQIALAAVGAEGLELKEGLGGLEPVVDVVGAPKAIVVEEGDPLEIGLEVTEFGQVPVALLGAKDHQIFFAELGRFGDWFETNEYGFVWQPAALNTDPGWRPYTRGRWLNSDQGWTWLSDEPFGWAVYHYGRWVLLANQGWVWVPGDDWGPAWVSWRQSDEYLGWAPLPPETLYDDSWDYDSGIDLAYDIAPDYYNFVPVDYFYEPVLPYCVPRVSVTTIVINTRNVTRFSTRGNRPHCGGPDFAWVNRHARGQGRQCKLDFGHGRDHFVGRGHHRVHDGRLEVFAPRVDAPWNAAVRPSRVSGYLGRVEAVRGGRGKINQELLHRHQRAAVQRHEAARNAMATKEGQVALRQNIHRQREVQNRPLAQGPPNEREQRRLAAEASLREASNSVAAAERRMQDRDLNPKQRSEARRMISSARKELEDARTAYTTRLNAGRQESVARKEGERAPGVGRPNRGGTEERGGGRGERPGPRRGGPEANANQEQQRLAAERRSREEKAAEAARVAKVERAKEVAEVKKKEEALAAARAEEEEARRRSKQENLNAKTREQARMATQQAEQRRLVAEKAAADERRRQEIAEKRRQDEAEARVAEEQRRAAEEKARIAEARKREASDRSLAADRRRQQEQAAAAAAQKADSRRQQIAEQEQAKAEQVRQAAAAQQKTRRDEQSRAAALENSQRQREAQKQAEAERQQALAQKRAEDAQRQAIAQKRAEDAQRQAALDAQRQRKAELDARRQAQIDAQRKAEARQAQIESQRRAAEQQARAESQRRAAAEAQQRARAESQQRAAAERARADSQRRAEADAQRRAAADQARQQAAAQQREAAERARSEARAAAQRQQAEAARNAQKSQSQGRGKRR